MGTTAKKKRDPVMGRIAAMIEKKGLTQQAPGERMDYPLDSDCKSVSQFLKTDDLRISTLRRFADAMGVKLSTLVKD